MGAKRPTDNGAEMRDRPELYKLALLTFTAGGNTSLVSDELAPEAHDEGREGEPRVRPTGGGSVVILSRPAAHRERVARARPIPHARTGRAGSRLPGSPAPPAPQTAPAQRRERLACPSH